MSTFLVYFSEPIWVMVTRPVQGPCHLQRHSQGLSQNLYILHTLVRAVGQVDDLRLQIALRRDVRKAVRKALQKALRNKPPRFTNFDFLRKNRKRILMFLVFLAN